MSGGRNESVLAKEYVVKNMSCPNVVYCVHLTISQHVLLQLSAMLLNGQYPLPCIHILYHIQLSQQHGYGVSHTHNAWRYGAENGAKKFFLAQSAIFAAPEISALA